MTEYKETHKICMEINIIDFYAIRAYEDFINKHIKSGNKIPNRVLKKFLLFFKKRVNSNYEYIQKQKSEIILSLNKIKNDVVERYSKDENYIYNSDTCSFILFIDIVFDKLKDELHYVWNSTEYNKRKEALIKLIYDSITEYFNEIKNKSLCDFFGKYKRFVIVGYIVWKFGFHLSQKITPKQLNGKLPTNQQLYESIKYHIGKIS